MTPDPAVRRAHAVGDRVQWRREVYRARFANRPIDHGTVEDVDGLIVKVRADHDGSLVTGHWSVFHTLTPLEDNRSSLIAETQKTELSPDDVRVEIDGVPVIGRLVETEES